MKPLGEWKAASLRRELHSHNSGDGRHLDALIDELLRRERERCLQAAVTAVNLVIFAGDYPEVSIALQAIRELT